MEKHLHDIKPRKWFIAGLLSLIEPGLGQIYNGQGRKGILFLSFQMLVFPYISLLFDWAKLWQLFPAGYIKIQDLAPMFSRTDR